MPLLALLLAAANVSAKHDDRLGKVEVSRTRAVRRCRTSSCAEWRCCNSFYYSAARKAFEEVFRRGQVLRDRRLGLRLDPHVEPAPGNRRLACGAQLAQVAIDKSRKKGPGPSASVTTSRPSPPTTRTSRTAPSANASFARAKAYEALAAKYPDDDEAQIFYALYLASTQTASDQTVFRVPQGSRQSSRSSSPSTPTIRVAHYLIHCL